MSVASLSVRKLDDETMARLRIQAAKNGVSMEEEARSILKRGVSKPEKLGDFAANLFAPAHGDEDLVLPEREAHDAIHFE